MEEIVELYSQPSVDFKRHIEEDGNERIIFSGRFGTGKTSFLKYFFNKKTQIDNFGKDKYNVIHLYPVNYSVANNDDIFKYLKYDILCSLLTKKQVRISKTEAKSYYKTFGEFGRKNIDKILGTFLLLIPKTGKSMYDFYKAIADLKDEYLKYHDEEAVNKDEDSILNFIENIEGTLALYEEDIITKLIEDSFKRIRKRGKENILVIDDLDRIDPEHIFRILNVFAAHFDLPERNDKSNKFGFDKIILVCDLNNVRNIFKVKYGIDTDFNGYIDKFYSKQIFGFDNRDAINSIIRNLISNTKIEGDEASINGFRNGIQNNFLIYEIILESLKYNYLSLRVLLGLKNNVFFINAKDSIELEQDSKISSYTNPVILPIQFLNKLFGGYVHFYEVLGYLENTSTLNNKLSVYISNSYKYVFEDLLNIHAARESNKTIELSPNNKIQLTYSHLIIRDGELGYRFMLEANRVSENSIELYSLSHNNGFDNIVSHKSNKFLIISVLKKTIELLHKVGYLH